MDYKPEERHEKYIDRKKQYINVSVELTRKTNKKVAILAAELDMTKSELIRTALFEFMNKQREEMTR